MEIERWWQLILENVHFEYKDDNGRITMSWILENL
jgi:hypothetical protein